MQEQHKTSLEEISRIVADIRETMARFESPEDFLQQLQVEIESVPGAMVSFGARTALDLREMGYFDGMEVSPEDAQAIIVDASLRYEDGVANQDHITDLITESLDARYPDSEVSP